MRFAEKVAKDMGHKSIRCDTYSENDKCIKFLKLLGYEQKDEPVFMVEGMKEFYAYEKILE